MSNGINAIKGFDYQATVILDRLFEHFDRNGPTARARPKASMTLICLGRRMRSSIVVTNRSKSREKTIRET